MKKIYMFLSGIVLICLSVSLSAQEVEIIMDNPSTVKAGEIFEVSVIISKGTLSDYSRFSQDLPPGLTATNVHSPNADFSFDNQRIRIIWLKLPEESEIKVTYNIMVDERLTGKFLLGGVFAYVVNEERKFLNFDKLDEITITPSATVDPAHIVDIKDFNGVSASAAVVSTAKQEVYAMAIRQKPLLLSKGGYLVKLLLKNPTGSKYAKIEEVIPSGYIFESVDSHDGIESFSSSTVKFIWMKLPQESEFELTYRLVPKRNDAQGAMNIIGHLTYSAGNENVVVKIVELDVNMESLTLADKRNLLLTGKVPSGAKKATPNVTTKTEPKPAKVSGQSIVNTRVLTAGAGVYYRVQLSANIRPFDARSFFRSSGVDQEVFVEKLGGLHKYTAGSFTNYNQAVSYKDSIEKLRNVSGAFVVAYRDGKRIPVPSTI